MRNSSKNKEYLEIEDINKMVAVAKCLRDEMLICLLQYCYVSDVLWIEVKNIDFAKYTITIVHKKNKSRLICHQYGKNVGKNFKFCPYCCADLTGINRKSLVDVEYRNLIQDFLSE